MKKLRITITVPDSVPLGTGLLFGLAEAIKDVPAIAENPRWRCVAAMDDGEVSVNMSWVKTGSALQR